MIVIEKFDPLTDAEIASAPGSALMTIESGEFISPAPIDAPKPSFFHPEFGEASQTWQYRDAAGATLQFICRFDPQSGPKQILPRTLWRDAAGSDADTARANHPGHVPRAHLPS